MVDKNTGATLGMSASLPTTYDDNGTTGYPSLTFTDIADIVDVGEVAKTWAVIAHQAVTREYPQKAKDTYDIPDIPITIGRVSSDAGQVLLQTALSGSASYAFEIVLPSTDTVNFTAKVTKAGLGAVASGAFSTTMVTLAVDPETIFES